MSLALHAQEQGRYGWKELVVFNICPGFEEPLALDISFVHSINPPQLVPTNAVNAIMPYNTTIPFLHGAPSAPQSSSSIPPRRPTPPGHSFRYCTPLTAYFFLFCSRNKTCLRTITSSSAIVLPRSTLLQRRTTYQQDRISACSAGDAHAAG